MSYNTLLVPLDGSKFSEQALPLALSIAHRSGAALRLVLVHTLNPGIYGYAGASVSFDVDKALLDAEESRLKETVAKVSFRSNLPCTAKVLTGVGTVEGLCSMAEREKADLIVMTTHGRGPWSRFWLGSVADEVVRTAICPVLTVRPKEGDVDLKAETTFREILVPLDGSPQSERVLEAAVAMGASMDAEYHLLSVAAEASQLDAAQHYLDSLVLRLKDLASPIYTHAVVGPHVATRILDVAEELNADLIAMETHGWRGFQRWRLGSVADKVLRGSSVPVLTHRTPVAVTTSSPELAAEIRSAL